MPSPAIPGKTRLGWIGTGVMGRSMCGHLIDRGFATTVYSRTKAKAEPLLAKRAQWADRPKAVAEQSDVIFCDRRLSRRRARGDARRARGAGRLQSRERCWST